MNTLTTFRRTIRLAAWFAGAMCAVPGPSRAQEQPAPPAQQPQAASPEQQQPAVVIKRESTSTNFDSLLMTTAGCCCSGEAAWGCCAGGAGCFCAREGPGTAHIAPANHAANRIVRLKVVRVFINPPPQLPNFKKE